MTTGRAVAHWVFDLDGTLADGLAATRLRPGACNLLTRLADEGARLSLWSAGGTAYATRVATSLGIAGSFGAIGDKVTAEAAPRTADASPDAEARPEVVGPGGRWVLPDGWADHDVVVCVDDEPRRLPHGVRVVAVRPWLGTARDGELVALLALTDQTSRSASAQ